MKVRIIVDFVRHAFSCANVIFVAGTQNSLSMDHIHEDSHNIAHDAVLTDLGIKQAQKLNSEYNQRIKGMDMIVCSELRRCMETAAIACQNLHTTIYCIPFISEINHSNDNCPIEFIESENNVSFTDVLTRNISKTYMKFHYPVLKGYPIIDNHILLERQNPDNPMPTVSNDYEFYHWVVPRIYQILSMKSNLDKGYIDTDGTKTYHIMAFTHYGHIKSHFDLYSQQIIDIFEHKPLIHADPRYHDKINDFVVLDKDYSSPYNVNIYTEIMELIVNRLHNNDLSSVCKVINTKMAMPCNCGKKCQSNHQIRIKDQVVNQQIKWHLLSRSDVNRCLQFHPLFKKYYDMISYREHKNKYIDLKQNLHFN